MTDSPAAPGGRWTAVAAARRLLAVARQEGPAKLGIKLLGELGYRRLGIFELRLDRLDPSPALDDHDDLDCHELGEGEPPPPGLDPGERAARLAAGHRCYLALEEERVLAAGWVAFGAVPLPYLGGAIRLSDGEACTYETWTCPAARGRGIGPALRRQLAAELRAGGTARLLAMIYPENEQSIRMVAKLGYRRIGEAVVLRRGERRRLGMRMRAGSVAPGRWSR